MSLPTLHPWTLDPVEAVRIQESLREKLVLSWDNRKVASVGGVGIVDGGDFILAAIAVLSYLDLSLVDKAITQLPATFPYIPGLLIFRIAPAILAAWEKLSLMPDVVMIHGHGTAHPRGCGLASHLGLWFNVPCIGVAKRRLYGFFGEVGAHLGDWSELVDEHDPQQVIGAVLRTNVNTKPIYVSPGHLIDLQHAMKFIMLCLKGFRLPVPIRTAHLEASRVHRSQSQKGKRGSSINY